MQTSVRPLNRSFSSPEILSSSTGETRFTNIGFDANDNALAVWSRSVAGQYMVQAVTRPKNGGSVAVADVSAGGVYSEAAPAVGVDAEGNAVAAWIGLTARAISP